MNANPILHSGYESKPSFYYEQARPEMQRLVPPDCKRLLDVGCSQGNFGAALKQTRKLEVWGIEPVAAAAAEATTKLDRVIEGIFDAQTPVPPGSFDCIVFNDVLEHVLDSVATLRLARKLLTPNGVIISSIPNMRHFPAIWELIVGKDWHYCDSGILDRTHLRFFTKKSILTLFADGGFEVEKIEGINPHQGGSKRKWSAFKIINGMTFKAIEDMRYLQFAVVARPLKKAT